MRGALVVGSLTDPYRKRKSRGPLSGFESGSAEGCAGLALLAPDAWPLTLDCALCYSIHMMNYTWYVYTCQ